MQSTILIITLAIMAALAIIFWLQIRAVSSDKEADAKTANTLRTRLIWGLTIVGIIVAILSLRPWPHAIASSDQAVRVAVTGGQWWWEVDRETIPLGKPINFAVTTEDVTHGMGIYDSNMRLLIQVQAIPGYTSPITYTFTKPGTYQILCMEYCGVAHHDMVNEFEVVKENG